MSTSGSHHRVGERVRTPSANNRGGGRGRGGIGGGRRSYTPRQGGRGDKRSSKTPQNTFSKNPNPSSTRHRATTAPSVKKDGEVGAASHTVSEEYRIQLTEVLLNFRETDSQDSITMPPDLTNTQRKFVHELAKQLGLKSKSYGKGEERRVVINKILAAGGMNSMMGCMSIDQNERRKDNDLPLAEDYKNVPKVDVAKIGEEAFLRHLSKFPPTPLEQAESRETGSSMLLKDDNIIVQDFKTLNDVLPTPQESLSPKQVMH